MIPRRAFLAVPPALALAAATGRCLAEPRIGMTFPACTTRDLNNRPHTCRELYARRTFVTVITAQGASEQMRHWLNNAEARLGRGGPILAIVALNVGPFAWDGIVWDQARSHTPAWRHGYVWLDRDGSLQRALGFPDESPLPWAFVVDRGGGILIAHHGIASDPIAERIWAAMAPG